METGPSPPFIMADATPTLFPFFELPPETRIQIYGYLLQDHIQTRIKLRTGRKPINKTFKNRIWITCTLGLAGTCQAAYVEMHDELLKHALTTPQVKLVAEVKDFDCRSLIKCMEWVVNKDGAFVKQTGFTMSNKFIVELVLYRRDDRCGESLSRWIRHCRSSSVSMTKYHIAHMDKPMEVLRAIMPLSGSFPQDPEMQSIAKLAYDFVVAGKVETAVAGEPCPGGVRCQGRYQEDAIRRRLATLMSRAIHATIEARSTWMLMVEFTAQQRLQALG